MFAWGDSYIILESTKTISHDFGFRLTEYAVDSLKSGAASSSAGRNAALHLGFY